MNIEQRIENKRKELEEERLNNQFLNPWSENYQRKNHLEKELAALESIAKEAEAV